MISEAAQARIDKRRQPVRERYNIDDELFDKILDHYHKGQGSIQDIARVYRVDVAAVLDITGNSVMKYIEMDGDLIDADDAGPGATMNNGRIEAINFTTD